MRNVTRYAATLLILAGCASAIECTSSCGPGSPHPDPIHVVIDCTRLDQAKVQTLVLQLLTLLTGGTPDWSAIEQQAIAAGESIGGCALAELIQGYLSPAKGVASASPENTRAARATFEHFRVHTANDATYRTPAGDL